MKSTNNRNLLVFIENFMEIKKISDKYTYKELEDIIEEIDKTRRRINANVNAELSLELLLMQMQK